MPMDDLFKALNMFSQGVKDLQTVRTINNANSEVQRIKASTLKEEEKTAEMKGVANQLTLQMAGLGVAPQTVAQLSGAIRNDPTDFESAIKLKEQESSDATKKLEKTHAFEKEQKALDRANALAIAQLKSTTSKDVQGMKGGPKKKPLSPTELKTVADAQEQQILAEDLLSRAKKNKGFFGIENKVPGVTGVRELADPEFADFKAETGRWFDAYRKKITGAQATEKEIKLLEKNQPVIGEPYSNFVKKVGTIQRIGQKVMTRYTTLLQAAGRDTGGVSEMQGFSATPEEQPSASQNQFTPATKYFKKLGQ